MRYHATQPISARALTHGWRRLAVLILSFTLTLARPSGATDQQFALAATAAPPAASETSAFGGRAGVVANEAPRSPGLRMAHDVDLKQVVLEIGPVHLAANIEYDDVAPSAAVATTFPVAGWLSGLQIEMVDGDGRVINDPLLHHVAIFSPGKRDLFSPVMLRVAAMGAETPDLELPGRLGYRFEAGDSLLVVAAFFNPTGVEQDAYLRLTLPYRTDRLLLPPISILPVYLDVVAEPGLRAFEIPPGISEWSGTWSPAIPGRILAIGGHLHQYGVSLVLEDVTTGKVLWRTQPVTDESGNVVAMPHSTFLGHRFDVRPDHVYRLTATYENPTDSPIAGAMGKVGGIFLPDPGHTVPEADLLDPRYRRDLDSNLGGQHHHHH